MREPGDADPFADGEALDAGAELLDDADDLVAGNDRQPLVRQLAVDDMQIGAADAAGLDADQHLAGPGAGSARSSSTSGAPISRSVIARIVFTRRS